MIWYHIWWKYVHFLVISEELISTNVSNSNPSEHKEVILLQQWWFPFGSGSTFFFCYAGKIIIKLDNFSLYLFVFSGHSLHSGLASSPASVRWSYCRACGSIRGPGSAVHIQRVDWRSFFIRRWWLDGKERIPVSWPLPGATEGGSESCINAIRDRFLLLNYHPS